MEKYILNIQTGTIHSANKPCFRCKNMKESNKKYFTVYKDAVDYFEGGAKKGKPCGICLKNMD